MWQSFFFIAEARLAKHWKERSFAGFASVIFPWCAGAKKDYIVSPVVLTHHKNSDLQKNGTLIDNQNNQNNQSFEMARKLQISVNRKNCRNSKNMAKTRGICHVIAFVLPFQFAIPHAIPKGNSNSKCCFGNPSFCLI